VWKDEKGVEHPTYTIITTTPNELVSQIHDRMPVILPQEKINEWLDRNNKDTDSLKNLLVPYPASEMQAVSVSKMVNIPRNDNPDLIRPIKVSDLPPDEKMEAQGPPKKGTSSTRGKRK
jgi:putative SOS response-associated peptidase YedK